MVARNHPWDVVRFVAHLPNFVKLFVRLMGDRRVHWLPKALLLAAGVYALSPLDFLPDLMPLLGQVDDLTIFAMGCRMFLRLCPEEVVREHVARIDEKWEAPV
jgi:uncharacterized membrane protein YkvA (DUF1232 family)